jgi:hypothetical protein
VHSAGPQTIEVGRRDFKRIDADGDLVFPNSESAKILGARILELGIAGLRNRRFGQWSGD